MPYDECDIRRKASRIARTSSARMHDVGLFEVTFGPHLLDDDLGLRCHPRDGEEAVASVPARVEDLRPLVVLRLDELAVVAEAVVHGATGVGVDDVYIDRSPPGLVATTAAGFDRDALLGFTGW